MVHFSHSTPLGRQVARSFLILVTVAVSTLVTYRDANAVESLTNSEELSNNIELCKNAVSENVDQNIVAACSWVLREDNINNAILTSGIEKYQFLMARGYAYRALGEYQNAEEDFRNAYEESFGYHVAHWMRADVLLSLGRLDEALYEINKAIFIVEFDPIYFVTRGQIYISREEYKKAIVNITKALNAKPDYTYLHFVLGEVYLRSGDYESALEQYELALSNGEVSGNLYGDISFILSTSDLEKNTSRRSVVEFADVFLNSTTKAKGMLHARAIIIYSLAIASTGHFEKAKEILLRDETELVSILGSGRSGIIQELVDAYDAKSMIECPSHEVCQRIAKVDGRKYASHLSMP